jgi:branched-chain amino acid transport system substrate-binding protein
VHRWKLLPVAAIVSVIALLAAACGSSSGSGSSGGKTVKIAFFGALTGDNAQLVIPGYDAAQMAVANANAGDYGKLPVKIQIVGQDTQGDPSIIPPLATKVSSDSSYVGVIGPAFSGESKAAGPTFNGAGIPFVTGSATNPGLAQNGWTNWFRAQANDNSQGPFAADYISKVVKPNCTFIASDGSTYGKGLADIVSSTLSKSGVKVQPQETVTTGQKDFSALVTKIKSSGCTAFFYGGYSPEASLIRKQMVDAGVTNVTMVGGDGIKDTTMLSQAGTEGNGTIAACPCGDITKNTSADAQKFISQFKAKYGTAPGIYSADYWDIAQMYIAAIKAGNTTRASITTYLHNLKSYVGLSKTFAFESNGELNPAYVQIYFYKDENQQWTFLGPASKVVGS